MPRLRDLLDRFRPAGAPGAASAAGVPVDRREGVVAELEPVFAALAGVDAACAELRRTARAQAQRCLEDARDRAGAIVSRATGSIAAERAAAAVTVRARAAEDV